ncbi:hypothetical protein NEAUS06_0463 [Nematocida ausubeli]|nr:hypothetical protein NEAUS06_0463 [Nematocida ausubeli]
MHVYASITVQFISGIVILMGTINLIRSFFLRSKRTLQILSGIFAWSFRNAFMYGVLYVIFHENMVHSIITSKLLGTLLYLGYLIVTSVSNNLKGGTGITDATAAEITMTVLWRFFVGICGTALVNAIDKEEVMDSPKKQAFVIVFLSSFCLFFYKVFCRSELSYEMRNSLPDGKLKSTLKETLHRMGPESYEIVTIDMETAMHMSPVHVETTGLITLLILNPSILDKYSISEIELIVVHHVIEHSLKNLTLFRTFSGVFRSLVYIVLFILLFGSLSYLPIFMRIILFCELTDLRDQIKSILFCVPCYIIERNVLKKVHKFMDISGAFPEPTNRLLRKIQKVSFSRHFHTGKCHFVLMNLTESEIAGCLGMKGL